MLQNARAETPVYPVAMTDRSRLQQQIDFLVEIDKLKQVLRRTWLMDQSCYENDAEHSWHIAVAAMLFGEYADDPKVDLLRVIKIWEEFEARQTPEARYAAALDRFQPLVHNYLTGGRAWREHGVTSDRVRVRNRPVADGSPTLWQYAEDLIRDAVEKGFLAR